MRVASPRVIGVMRTATSLRSSVAVPPAPHASTGPKLLVLDHAHQHLHTFGRDRLHLEAGNVMPCLLEAGGPSRLLHA